MATIHLVDGEKGGVGKSLFAITMVQYCLDKQLPFVAVETDRSNPDVSSRYKDICQYAIFSESEKYADRADKIFEMAIDKPVIVSLPSQVHRAFSEWIEKNNLIEVGKVHGVSFCKWFVCNGGYDSIQLFIQSLKSYGSTIKHIFVRNWGLCDDWEHVDENDELEKLRKKYKVKTLDFPKLAYKERNIIDEKRLSFADAREYKQFGVLNRQRVVNFLKAAYAEIELTGALKNEKAK